jgi:hypothetical protein
MARLAPFIESLQLKTCERTVEFLCDVLWKSQGSVARWPSEPRRKKTMAADGFRLVRGVDFKKECDIYLAID